MTLTVYDKNFQITRKGQTIENETDGTNILRIRAVYETQLLLQSAETETGKKAIL